MEKGVFRTQSNIYDGAILLKLLTIFTKNLNRGYSTGF